MFVGAVADNFGENIQQKVFHGQLVVGEQQMNELENLKPIPVLPQWEGVTDEQANAMLQQNYNRVKDDVAYIIRTELEWIRGSEEHKHLLRGLKTQNKDYLTREDGPQD